MPEEEKTIYLGCLATVDVKAESLLKQTQQRNKARLLAVPAAYYYENVQYWRDAMAYMRIIGDREAEGKIFMKRFAHSREQATKGVLALTGGFVVAGFAPGALLGATASPTALYLAGKCSQVGKIAFQMYNSSVAIRMGINATTQAITEKDGWRGVNLVSVFSESIPFGLNRWGVINLLTTLVEYRPFNPINEWKFRCIGYNKSFSEAFYDIGAQAITTGIDKGISNVINKGLQSSLQQRTEKYLWQYFAKPVLLFPYNFGHRVIINGTKKDLGIDGEKEE